MKRKFINRFIYDQLRLITLIIYSFWGISCTDITKVDSPPEREESPVVRIAINTPSASLPRNAFLRSTIIDPESHIAEVKVMVFEQEGEEYLYKYMLDGKQLQTNVDLTTQFEIKLNSSRKSLKLLLLANYADAFHSYEPVVLSDINTITRQVISSFENMWATRLPMYAVIDLPDGIGAEKLHVLTATMLRAIARVDLIKELESDSKEFDGQEVHIYRANSQIQLIPEPTVVSDSKVPIVTGASVPDSSECLAYPFTFSGKESEHIMAERIYLPESLPVLEEKKQLYDATCIVVGGYYNNDQSRMHYYRIDFNSKLPGHPFGQVLRNHKYIFKIKKVLGPGWSTPDEAANNKATSIVAEVQAWEDFTTEMFFNGNHYLGVSARRLKMRYGTGREREIAIQSDIKYTIQWLDHYGNGIGEAVSEENMPLLNEDFSAQIVKYDDDQSDVSHIVFTTLNANKTWSEVTGKLRISAGNWHFDITIVQDTYNKYVEEYIQVFSISGEGDLGTPAGVSSANGQAMRAILSHPDNFSPNGTIRIAGVNFNSLDNTYSSAALGTSKYNTIKNSIYESDVVYLTPNNYLSNDVAMLIFNWLRAKPNRVLILGADSQNTSQALLNNFLRSDADWWYFCYQGNGYHYDHLGETTTPVKGGFSRAPLLRENRAFFDGPFGKVSASALIDRYDSNAGYARTYSKYVSPLLVVSSNPNYMIAGINKESRIVYGGDFGNLFQYRANRNLMSSNSGVVQNDLDKLLANLWVWIIEQVLYGE
ncbi:hypothetical protein LJB85_00350 [Porphyromonadaceae bacterium OttesenSCG-928-L07]|nr:hypothetical protein [Porphyromonadaceae bacterium OttesenSCG-928-L07]MDL2251637.1 hypothetical protein [Odoribacter sp. OttesenSCG-928-J03]